MIYFLAGEILDKIGSAVVDALRAFNLTIASLFYKLIIETFNIFIKIGNSTIIHDSDLLLPILNRISIILGIFMIFRVTFAFIEYIVNPDNMFDKNKGIMNIVKRIVIAIVLLGSTNMLFDFAYRLQDKIITEDVIPQIILGDTSTIENNERGDGGTIAVNLFSCFFRPNPKFIDEDYDIVIKSDEDIDEEMLRNIQYAGIQEEIKYGVFSGVKSVINVKADINDDEEEYLYEFDAGGLACLALGVFACYIVLVYTMQVGVRLFQLAYLQIIAPIPIMMYITPKGEEKLKKWGQQCATTYLDFFIRTAIMYFIIFIIKILSDSFNEGSISFSNLWTGHVFTDGYILAILILGLLLFAKKLPNLLKEIFPSLGGGAAFDYGIDFKKNVAEPFKSLYNAPVLGWGLKLGNGAIKGFDRKAHGKAFFGDSALRKQIDKWLPEQAEARKQRLQAKADSKERESKYKKGEKLYNKYNKELKASDFKHEEYGRSYETVSQKKKDLADAENQLSQAQARLNAAYSMPAETEEQKLKRQQEITKSKELLQTANKNVKGAQGALELAKARHDSNKKIFTDDAAREENFKFYDDTHKPYEPIPDKDLNPYDKEKSSEYSETQSQNNASQTQPDASTINNQLSGSNQNNTPSSTNNSSSSTNSSEQQSDPRDGLVENDYDQFGEISPEYRSEASNNNQERQDPRDGLYNNDYDENGEITQSFTPGDE